MPRLLTGCGLMIGGDRNNDLKDIKLKNPKVKHITYRDRWSRMNPAKGQYNFDHLRQQVDRYHKYNKPWALGVMTGTNSPLWLPGPRIKNNKGERLIAPWEPSLPGYYSDLHYKLQEEFGTDTLLSEVWMTGVTVPSQEMHLNGIQNATGFSNAKMVNAWKKIIDIFKPIWTAQSKVLSLSAQTQAYWNQVIDYAIAVLNDAATFQINSLGTQTSPVAKHILKLKDLAAKGRHVGAEAVQPGHAQVVSKYPWLDWFVGYDKDEIHFP
jgi:hypothetical protein